MLIMFWWFFYYLFGRYQDIISLKQWNPQLKVLLALGGRIPKLALMVSKPNRMAKFVFSTTTFLRSFDFDGIDLDWEFGAIDHPLIDKSKYGVLCMVSGIIPTGHSWGNNTCCHWTSQLPKDKSFQNFISSIHN